MIASSGGAPMLRVDATAAAILLRPALHGGMIAVLALQRRADCLRPRGRRFVRPGGATVHHFKTPLPGAGLRLHGGAPAIRVDAILRPPAFWPTHPMLTHTIAQSTVATAACHFRKMRSA